MDAISPVGNGTSAGPPISFAAAQRAARAYGGKVTPAAPQPATRTPTSIQRLVAAVVPGSVDFSGSTPSAAPGAMAFYRNPADRNAAAIGVEAGRSLDVTG
ncbi:MAG: hypothetical protein U0637_13280 [Phycisphaerales bacterium]